MAHKRRFGRVRRLPSGRFQARHPGPDGTDRPTPQTFATKRAAEVWLTLKEGEIKRGDWLDPSAGAVPFAKYAADWLGQRQLSPKTAQLFELLRLHVIPALGEVSIGTRPGPGRGLDLRHVGARSGYGCFRLVGLDLQPSDP